MMTLYLIWGFTRDLEAVFRQTRITSDRLFYEKSMIVDIPPSIYTIFVNKILQNGYGNEQIDSKFDLKEISYMV